MLSPGYVRICRLRRVTTRPSCEVVVSLEHYCTASEERPRAQIYIPSIPAPHQMHAHHLHFGSSRMPSCAKGSLSFANGWSKLSLDYRTVHNGEPWTSLRSYDAQARSWGRDEVLPSPLILALQVPHEVGTIELFCASSKFAFKRPCIASVSNIAASSYLRR